MSREPLFYSLCPTRKSRQNDVWEWFDDPRLVSRLVSRLASYKAMQTAYLTSGC